MDGHSPSIWTVARGRCIAELVDAGDDATEGVVTSASYGEADMCGKVGLPCRRLPPKIVIPIAGREPRHVCHVERNKPRRGDHAAFVVILPGRGLAVGLRLGDLVTAIPVRNRRLAGEVLGSDALACRVVRHAVTDNSIPRTVDECLGFPFNGFAAAVRQGCITRCLAGDWRGRLLVEVGDRLSLIPRHNLSRGILDNEFARIEAYQHLTIACYRINPPDNWLWT